MGAAADATLKNIISRSSIFPNPASSIIRIGSIEKVLNVQIFNVAGKLVLNSKNNGNKIDVSSLQAGIYVVRYRTANKETIEKLVVE